MKGAKICRLLPAVTLALSLVACAPKADGPVQGTSSGDVSISTGESSHTAETLMPTQKESEEMTTTTTTARQTEGSHHPDPTTARTSAQGTSAPKTTAPTTKGTQQNEEPATYIQHREPLQNTYAKWVHGEPITVAYYGGSVTYGTGASNPSEKTWRALVTRWLEEHHPDGEVKEINAALGGTGSMLGAYRVERDVIPYQPDLVFIEFAINDTYCLNTPDEIRRYYEAIVRRLRESNPYCDIVAVYSTDAIRCSSSPLYAQAAAQEEVAVHYNLPSINMGKSWWWNRDWGIPMWAASCPTNG